MALKLRRRTGIITNESLLQTTGAVSFKRVSGSSAATPGIRYKRVELRRRFPDLVLAHDLAPQEPQGARDLDSEANGCLPAGTHVLVRRPHLGAEQICGIHKNVRPQLVDRHLYFRRALRFQDECSTGLRVALEA